MLIVTKKNYMPEFVLKIMKDGDIEIYKDGVEIMTFVDCYDWVYGNVDGMQELFDELEITNVKVE